MRVSDRVCLSVPLIPGEQPVIARYIQPENRAPISSGVSLAGITQMRTGLLLNCDICINQVAMDVVFLMSIED
jgi:hypothetical protein